VNLDIGILLPFTLLALAITIWGWTLVARKRKRLRWPTVEGVIEKFDTGEAEGEMFPIITFGYTVAGREYHNHLSHTGGTPPPEYAIIYTRKYPQGTKVKVYYNPADPADSTIEPGVMPGHWIIFIVGLSITLVGIGALLID